MRVKSLVQYALMLLKNGSRQASLSRRVDVFHWCAGRNFSATRSAATSASAAKQVLQRCCSLVPAAEGRGLQVESPMNVSSFCLALRSSSLLSSLSAQRGFKLSTAAPARGHWPVGLPLPNLLPTSSASDRVGHAALPTSPSQDRSHVSMLAADPPHAALLITAAT